MSLLQLDPKKTAFVAIDLQNAVVGMQTAPYSAADVVERSSRLAKALREKGGTVVFVRVLFSEFLNLPVDVSRWDPKATPPPEASEIVPGAGFEAGDLLVSKPHWGAFAGTDLGQQLRERGIDTIVLTGIATNFGVESTARQGTGLGFGFVVVEDACSSLSAEAHEFAFTQIFPYLARVRSTEEVLAALV
jgi:nicotinamidase-related amidase